MPTPPGPLPSTDLSRVLESLPDPFFILDVEWRFTFINGHGARFVSRDPAELLGQVFWEAFPDLLGTRFEWEMRRARQEGQVVEYQEYFAPLRRWLEVRVFPDGDGIGVHYRDVTGRVLGERRTRALSEVTAALARPLTRAEVTRAVLTHALPALEAYGGIVVRPSPDGQAIEVEQTVGYDEAVASSWSRFDLSAPFPATDCVREGRAIFAREEDLARDYPLLLTSKSSLTRSMAALPLRFGERVSGALLLSFAEDRPFDDAERQFMLDITAQCAQALERAQTLEAERQAARAVRDREERYRIVSNVTNDALWEWEFAGDTVTWNEGVSRLFGYPREEVEATGQWWKDHLHPGDRERVLRGIGAVIAGTEEEWRDEYRYRRRDGSYATVLDRGQVIRDEHGQALRMIGGMTDLSERERHRAELAALNASLERRVEVRTEELRERAAELQAETDALSAFAEFTQAVGNEADLPRLASLAVETLIRAFEDGSAVYYEREGEVWRARAWTRDFKGETLDLARQGFPLRSLLPDLTTTDPLFMEDWGSQGGGIGARTAEYGTAAFSPIFQEGQLSGLLTAGLKGAQHWTPRDQAVFRAVGHGLALAAERATHLRRLEEERAATAAFAAFTEGVGTETDVPTLARQAVQVLATTLDNVSVGYYEVEDGRWKGRVLSEGLAPEVRQAALAGFGVETPSFAQAVRAADVLFVDGWNAAQEGAAGTEMYNAAALFPYFVGGQPYGLLTMASSAQPTWTARARAVFSSVARGLGLAFERAETARVLQEQNAELHARTRALEGFSDLARELAFETDPAALVRRAQEIVLGLLPQGVALYYEPQGDLWRVRVQTGDVGNADLQATLDAGLPLEETGNLILPWRTGEAYYQDAYAPDTDGLPEQTGHIGATATVPILVNGQPQGVLAVALFGTRAWDETDRAVLDTAARHLTLALERAAVAAELDRQRAELQATNRELEAFSYTVSHDLRAPLRHIAGFTGMLRRAVETGNAAKAARALDVIEGSVSRAGDLIEALLNFSHLSRRDLTKQPVDLGRLVESVRAEAEGEAGEREVEWVVADLHEVQGDPDLLRQVLSNLLSNAVKYSSRSESIRVEVGSERRTGETVIFVRDSGAGFDPRHADKLFGVFQRLHHQDEFQGTGIGLATVRRIVQRHGGRVWAHSTPGEGATFHFSLPEEEGGAESPSPS